MEGHDVLLARSEFRSDDNAQWHRSRSRPSSWTRFAPCIVSHSSLGLAHDANRERTDVTCACMQAESMSLQIARRFMGSQPEFKFISGCRCDASNWAGEHALSLVSNQPSEEFS